MEANEAGAETGTSAVEDLYAALAEVYIHGGRPSAREIAATTEKLRKAGREIRSISHSTISRSIIRVITGQSAPPRSYSDLLRLDFATSFVEAVTELGRARGHEPPSDVDSVQQLLFAAQTAILRAAPDKKDLRSVTRDLADLTTKTQQTVDQAEAERSRTIEEARAAAARMLADADRAAKEIISSAQDQARELLDGLTASREQLRAELTVLTQERQELENEIATQRAALDDLVRHGDYLRGGLDDDLRAEVAQVEQQGQHMEPVDQIPRGRQTLRDDEPDELSDPDETSQADLDDLFYGDQG